MKTLYIECNMGAAGDMLMSALSELHPDAEGFMTRLSQIGIPDVTFERRQAVKCGIVGTHIEVRVNGISEGEEVHEHSKMCITMKKSILIATKGMRTTMKNMHITMKRSIPTAMRNMTTIMSIITHIPIEVWLRLRISSLRFRCQTV